MLMIRTSFPYQVIFVYGKPHIYFFLRVFAQIGILYAVPAGDSSRISNLFHPLSMCGNVKDVKYLIVYWSSLRQTTDIRAEFDEVFLPAANCMVIKPRRINFVKGSCPTLNHLTGILGPKIALFIIYHAHNSHKMDSFYRGFDIAGNSVSPYRNCFRQ